MIHMLSFLFTAVTYLLQIYSIMLFASAILRMARADETSIIGRLVFPLTDPPANALKRRFPKLVVYHSGAYIDFSTLALIIAVQLLIMFVAHLRAMVGA
ncbi:MAG: YggT family protein [Betaproteobacteria bacterium]|nr:YggT family protein [Betaproteobacteria bacterium]